MDLTFIPAADLPQELTCNTRIVVTGNWHAVHCACGYIDPGWLTYEWAERRADRHMEGYM